MNAWKVVGSIAGVAVGLGAATYFGLPKLLQRENPVLLHLITKKGKGLAPAE